MKQYKYNLDKSSKKFNCPKCDKKTFVLFINNETNQYLPFEYGRCDRENECSYFISPPTQTIAYLIPFKSLSLKSVKAYKMIDLNGLKSFVPKSQILELLNDSCWITEWFLKSSKIKYLNCESKNFNNEDANFINTVLQIGPTPKRSASFHDYNIVTASGRNFKQNNFIQFLKTIFSEDEIKAAIKKYLIGTSKHWNGATVFWQIDNNENVRHGKIMLFNTDNGKRSKNKEGKGFISSVRSVLKLNDFELQQCLFGLHLINEKNTKTIGLVESEKTAIIMSIFKPEYIWLATGSKSGLKAEFLEPIKDYKIIAFPDKSEYFDWLSISIKLNGFGFKIVVNDWLEQQDEYSNGTDLADVYINELSNNKFDEVIYTETEKRINTIEQHTPEIRLLIETFDLVDNEYNEIRKII